MAAILHAKILADGYTPGLLRAAMTGTLVLEDLRLRPKVVQPQRLVAPRPTKSAKCFEKIINWEEDVVAVSPRSADELSPLLYEEYPVSRVLDGPHSPETKDATHASNYPFAKWPPSTDFFRDHPLWHRAETPDPFNPFQDYEEDVYDAIAAAARPAPQLTLAGQGHWPPPAAVGHDTKAPTVASPGFFVGRDGVVWPLPPAQPAPAYPPGLPHPPPQRAPQNQALAQSDPFPARAPHQSPLDRPAPGLSPNSDCVSKSSSATSTSTSAGLPTPPRLALKVSPNVGVIGDGRPRPRPDQASRVAAASPTGERTLTPLLPDTEEDYSPATENALGILFGFGLERAAARDSETETETPTKTKPGFFRGRDGVEWPLPPSRREIEDLLEEMWGGFRGRASTHEWSWDR